MAIMSPTVVRRPDIGWEGARVLKVITISPGRRSSEDA